MFSGRAAARHAALAGSLLAAVTLSDRAAGDPAPPRVAATAPSHAPKPAPRAAGAVAKRPPSTSPVPASRAWHAPLPGKAVPKDERGHPMLALQALNTAEHVEIAAGGERGGFAPDDLDRAARVLREPGSGNEHPVDPRLLDLVYRIQLHFSAQEVRIISGYRTPRASGTSNHGKGRAMDIVVPGASDEDVARFVREQGFVGCGVYPVSGFVHVDVRERSYFWVDASGPGKKNRTRGILGDLAARADARAFERGERPIGPFVVARDVDALLAAEANASAAPPAAPGEDDDVEGTTLPD
jgi:uncharacterized protein YcbK (DUF882 family)